MTATITMPQVGHVVTVTRDEDGYTATGIFKGFTQEPARAVIVRGVDQLDRHVPMPARITPAG